MLKAHKTSPHGTRGCLLALSVRKRVVQRVCVRYANGDADSAPVEQPPEPTEFVPYAPPQYPAQYYQTAPQLAPPPPPPPASTGTPFWVWLLVGAALHWVYTKVQEFRKNPMAAIAGMMGGAKPGVGGAGGGDMAQMMEMMQRMQQQQQQQQQSRAPGAPFNGMASNTTTINTTASDVVPPTSQSQTRSGAKFEENKKSSTNGGSSPAASSQPDVQPQTTSSFFSDTQTAEPASQPSFFQDTSSNAGQQTGTSQADAAASEAMVENMLLMVADNKQLRDQLGMHLPESMNNDATWKWIKENPDIRKQMAKQISPGLAAQFGDMSMFNQYTNTPSNDELMNQMKSMGVDPGVMMSKVMADPEVMQIMTKPHVAQALMEMQSNPASAMKYMSDPDVFKLMQKIVEMNPALKNANMPPPPASS